MHEIDYVTFGWRLTATLIFVLLNGFFVAAEFALVKVRPTQLDAAAERGSRRAQAARHIHRHLDHYLSACQLGITLASLILGWLAEPAIAELLLALGAAAGIGLDPSDPLLHGVALAVALTIVTTLHMTIGEQAPKIWSINRAEPTALGSALPLRAFAALFGPFIWVINSLSNGLLRLAGMSAAELQESQTHSAEELKRILISSAEAGHISRRQLEIARNVLEIIALEVRHILVPRVDIVFLSLQKNTEENLALMRASGHSRFPLCDVGLDTVIGIVHAKEVMSALAQGESPDLRKFSRKPVHVSDTQPLSRLILQLQRSRSHCAVVHDEHGTAIGLAFLEDALEEIVGPLYDEFDEEPEGVRRLPSGAIEIPGTVSLPEASAVLGLEEIGDEADTIGGHVVALLGRLPRKGDALEIGEYRVTVAQVLRHRIERLRFEPIGAGEESAAG